MPAHSHSQSDVLGAGIVISSKISSKSTISFLVFSLISHKCKANFTSQSEAGFFGITPVLLISTRTGKALFIITHHSNTNQSMTHCVSRKGKDRTPDSHSRPPRYVHTNRLYRSLFVRYFIVKPSCVPNNEESDGSWHTINHTCLSLLILH